MNFLYRAIQFGFMHIWPALVLVVSAAFLKPEQLGAIAIFMSVATLFRPFIGLSLGRAAIRSAGRMFAIGGSVSAQRVIHLTARMGFVASLVGLPIALGAVLWVNDLYDLGLSYFSLFACIAFIYAFGITEFLDGLLRAQGKFRSLAVSVGLSRLVGISLFLLVLPGNPDVEYLFLILCGSELIAILLLLQHVIPAFRPGSALGIRSHEALVLLRDSIPVIINALSVYLYARAMVMIVAPFDDSANIGSFELVVQLTSLPMAVTIICSTVISPAVARLVAQGDEGRRLASETVSYGAAFSVWANMLAAGYLMIVGPVALMWLLPQLTLAPLVLLIIAPLVAFKAYAQILSGEIAIATGTAGLAAKITMIFAAVTVAFGYVLSIPFGIQGAAWAMLLAHSLAALATVIFLGRHMGLNLNYRTKASLLTVLLAGLPSLGVVWLLRDSPAAATIAGSLCFLVMALSAVLLSVRFGWPLHAPLVDGLNMLKSKNIQIEEFHALSEMIPGMASDSAQYRKGLLHLVAIKSPKGHAFWFHGQGNSEGVPLQDHADIVYTAYLLGEGDKLNPAAALGFFDHVAGLPLFGKAKKGINAHLSAYLLGAVRLLQMLGKGQPNERLYNGWRRDLLLDSSNLPKWPRIWSHHIWRVSHWIGGVTSIILHLAETGKVDWATRQLVNDVFVACEAHILDRRNGLLRPYKAQLLQNIFRKLYQLRHDPDIADLGGLVHLLWAYHVAQRAYVGQDALNRAADLHLERTPFMEEEPYCLDFDILQLKRTVVDNECSATQSRGKKFVIDTLNFFVNPVKSTYTLHKLAGALAALHEATWLAGEEIVDGIHVNRIDIIKEAYWL